jgi:hypothetical protein
MNSIICEPYRQMCLYMCVMVDQREALAVTTDLLTQFIWFALPGFEPSTLGSVCSISSSWVKIRLHTENHLLGLPGSLGGCAGVVGWVPLHYVSILTSFLVLGWAVTIALKVNL